MFPLHSLTLKMWILMYYMPYFWHLDHLIMRFCVDVGHWENGAVCESHAFPTMSSRSFVIPTPQWLILDMQTNAGIRLPVRSSFGGLRCSTTILSVGKICIYASQNYTLVMFNGTYVLKWTKITYTMSLNTSLNTSSLTGSRNIMPS